MNASKIHLTIINLIFFVLSIFLITAGSFKLDSASFLPTMFRDYLSIPAGVMMSYGAMLLSISILAFVGLHYRSRLLLSAYMATIALLVVVQLALGIGSWMARSHALSQIVNYLRHSASRYGHDPLPSAYWNLTQRDLKCCGVHNYNEWFRYFDSYSVPDACCAIYYVDCGRVAVSQSNIHKTGCAVAVYEWAQVHELPVIIIFAIFSILQIISFPISRCCQRVLGQ